MVSTRGSVPLSFIIRHCRGILAKARQELLAQRFHAQSWVWMRTATCWGHTWDRIRPPVKL